eukprot:gene9343-10870_t
MSVVPGPGALSSLHVAITDAAAPFARSGGEGGAARADVVLRRLRGWATVCMALGRLQDAGADVADLSRLADAGSIERVESFLRWFRPVEQGAFMSWAARGAYIAAWSKELRVRLRRLEREATAREVAEHWADSRYQFDRMRQRLGATVPSAVEMVRLPDGSISTDPVVVRRELAGWGMYQSVPAFSAGGPGVNRSLREEGFAFYRRIVDEWVPRANPFRCRTGPDGSLVGDAETWLRRDITWDEFERALFRKMGMAAGEDLITQEILQDLPEDARRRLFAVVSDHWRAAWDGHRWRYPDSLKHAWIAPVPKKGYNGSTDRLRPIAVTSVLARLYNRVVYERLYWHLEASGCLSHLQDGFRARHNASTAVSRMQAFVSAGPCHLAGLDIQRAFDSVDLRFARHYLRRAGVPQSMIEFFFSQLDGCRAYVWSRYGRAPGDGQPSFPILRGGKMGAIETPMMFLCIVDPMIHWLSARYPGALVCAYADDILLGHRDPVVLARMVADARMFVDK